MLHRTLLYSQRVTECFIEQCCTHTQNTQSASQNTAVLRESDRARCSTGHCCTHREWQSASQNTALLIHRIHRVPQRTLLYSQRVAECFTEHSCIHREWQSASQNTAVLTEWQSASENTAVLIESDRVLQRTLLYSQRVTECFREHSCTQSGSAFRHTTDFHNHNNKKIYIYPAEKRRCALESVYSFVWLKKRRRKTERKRKRRKKGKKKMVVA